MSVSIATEFVPFVRDVIASGRCGTETEVVNEALRVFRDIEQRLQQLREQIQEGIDSGPSIPGEEVFARLELRAQELARRGA